MDNPAFHLNSEGGDGGNAIDGSASNQCHVNPKTSLDAEEGKEVKQQVIGLQYYVDDIPPWPLTFVLGFQHFLTMVGSTIATPFVLAPALCMTEDDPARGYLLCSILFISGLITVLQSTVGVRLPIVQGGSFAFLIPIMAILALEWKCPDDLSKLDEAAREKLWVERTLEMQGALAVASVVQVLMGAFGVVGAILRFITPLTVAPAITMVGLTFYPTLGTMMAKSWTISISTLILVTLSSQYLQNVGIPLPNCSDGPKKRLYIFKFFPVLIAMLAMWLLCALLTVFDALPSDSPIRTDRTSSLIHQSPWFRMPYPGQWGLPTVSASAVIGVWAGTIACTVESVGDYFACARISGSPTPPVHAINRGIMVEGLGCILAALWGGINGTTSYCENIGTISVTRVGSRRVVQVAGLIMMVIGTFSKLGALFATIPEAIVGGIFCATFGVVITVGISNLQSVDLNSSRNLFVFGVSIMIGLVVPNWAKKNSEAIKTGSAEFDHIVTILLSTSMLLAGLVGFVLDNTIPGTNEERGLAQFAQQSADDEDGSVYSSYDLPFGMNYIKSHKWIRYVPIIPGYKGLDLCGRFRRLITKKNENVVF